MGPKMQADKNPYQIATQPFTFQKTPMHKGSAYTISLPPASIRTSNGSNWECILCRKHRQKVTHRLSVIYILQGQWEWQGRRDKGKGKGQVMDYEKQ